MTPEEPPVNPAPAAASPEVPAAPEFLAPPPEPDPFWGYSDLLWFLAWRLPECWRAGSSIGSP